MSDDLEKEKEVEVETEAGKAKGTDESKDKLAALQIELDQMKGKFQEAIDTRQKAKEKERKTAEENGNYVQATGLMQEQMIEVKAQLEEAKLQLTALPELEQYKEKYTAYEETRRASILETLPEGKREEFKDMPIDTLEKVVGLLSSNTNSTFKGGQHNKGGGKDWGEMSSAERIALMRDSPDLASQKIKQAKGKKEG